MRKLFKIGILGGNGFLGSILVNNVFNGKHCKIFSITKTNYNKFIGKKFDVLINANGNSKKYLAELNPKLDFDLSVKSVYNSIFDFKFKRYIYISSIDANYTHINYGLNKNIAETILRYYKNKCGYQLGILRCGAIIGKNMKKGIVYDILNNRPLKVTIDSKIWLISGNEIAKIINRIIRLNKKQWNSLFECIIPYLIANKSISVMDIGIVLNKILKFDKQLEYQSYNEFIPHTNFKSPEYYLKELINA